jgi:geranylgeranyl diphosphate synthase type II
LNSNDFNSELKKYAQLVNNHLDKWLPLEKEPGIGKLNAACRYSVLGGGKRIRAILALLTGKMYGCDSLAFMRLGCAIELVHAYSLIHDDLPAMDDDDFRRGQPTNHKVFGEGMAILAGDNLLTLAFSWLATLTDYNVSCEKTLQVIRQVSAAAGHRGMIGGQVLDIQAENIKIDRTELEKIHMLKTGALLKAPVCCSAILANAPQSDRQRLSNYSHSIGLLFQVIDDILDVEGDAESLGKEPGADARLGKSTYPALLGMEQARDLAQKLVASAHDSLKGIDADTSALAQMADLIYSRKN